MSKMCAVFCMVLLVMCGAACGEDCEALPAPETWKGATLNSCVEVQQITICTYAKPKANNQPGSCIYQVQKDESDSCPAWEQNAGSVGGGC
jgi:hypothetical protein